MHALLHKLVVFSARVAPLLALNAYLVVMASRALLLLSLFFTCGIARQIYVGRPWNRYWRRARVTEKVRWFLPISS